MEAVHQEDSQQDELEDRDHFLLPVSIRSRCLFDMLLIRCGSSSGCGGFVIFMLLFELYPCLNPRGVEGDDQRDGR